MKAKFSNPCTESTKIRTCVRDLNETYIFYVYKKFGIELIINVESEISKHTRSNCYLISLSCFLHIDFIFTEAKLCSNMVIIDI